MKIIYYVICNIKVGITKWITSAPPMVIFCNTQPVDMKNVARGLGYHILKYHIAFLVREEYIADKNHTMGDRLISQKGMIMGSI